MWKKEYFSVYTRKHHQKDTQCYLKLKSCSTYARMKKQSIKWINWNNPKQNCIRHGTSSASNNWIEITEAQHLQKVINQLNMQELCKQGQHLKIYDYRQLSIIFRFTGSLFLLFYTRSYFQTSLKDLLPVTNLREQILKVNRTYYLLCCLFCKGIPRFVRK